MSDSQRVPFKTSRGPTFRTVIPLIIIGAVAIGLSLLSYQYSILTSEKIALAATDDLKNNARIQAYDMSKSLENRLESIRSNLEIIANAPLVQRGEYVEARPLINAAEKSTDGFTDSYFWIDESGKLQWAGAFVDQEVYDQYYGADRTDRPYFTDPRDNHQPYFSPLRDSVDGIPRIYIAYPIVTTNQDSIGIFKGVVVASMNLKSLGNSITKQLPPDTQSAVSLMDRDGTILYTQNDALLGKNYFSEEVQNLLFPTYLPREEQDSFNRIMRDSIAGNSGIGEYSSSGVPMILAYNPVMFERGIGSGQPAMSLHLSLPKAFATDIALLIEQQRNLSAIVPAVIGAVAVSIALIVIRWNSKLERTVKERTIKLEVANERLKDHDRAQREFINIAAHELRTPIQPLIGIAEALEEQFRTDGKDEILVRKAEVEMITRNAKRLLNLSSDILEVSRIESKTMQLGKEAIDLTQKIKLILDDMHSVIPLDKRVRLRFDSKSSKTVMVDGDRERIFQVISNLLNNAIKFTDKGDVVVELEEKNGQAIVHVRDSGNGIAPEIYPKLFTKFATKSDKGTGLGLYVAKNIVEAHGGNIWAENNNDGKGATFTFTLPLSKYAVKDLENATKSE